MKLETTVPQTLLTLKGPVGIGKSALSRSLGQRLGWPVVDKDDFSDVLLTRIEHYGSLAYDSMFSVAESLSKQGFSVICDSPLRGEMGYLNAKKLAERSAAELRVLDCTLSDEAVWKTRLETRQRRPAHVLKTWADLTRYRNQAVDDFDYPVTTPVLMVDTALPLEQNLERILTWLQTEAER